MFSIQITQHFRQKALGFVQNVNRAMLQYPPSDSSPDPLWLGAPRTPCKPAAALICKHTAPTGGADHAPAPRVPPSLHPLRPKSPGHYPMLARKELPGPVGDRGLSCSSYTGGGIAALEDCERGRESSS